MAVTPERALVSVREFPLHITVINIYGFVTAVSLLKPPGGGLRSETITMIEKHKKKSVGTPRKL
jgi:hypothetical protein